MPKITVAGVLGGRLPSDEAYRLLGELRQSASFAHSVVRKGKVVIYCKQEDYPDTLAILDVAMQRNAGLK